MTSPSHGIQKYQFNYVQEPIKNENIVTMKKINSNKGLENDDKNGTKKIVKPVITPPKYFDNKKINDFPNVLRAKSTFSNTNINYKNGTINNPLTLKGKANPILDIEKAKDKKDKNQGNKNFMVDYGVLEGVDDEITIPLNKVVNYNNKDEITIEDKHTMEQYDKRKHFCEKLLSIKSFKALLICPAFKDNKYKPMDYTKKAYSENPSLNRYDDVFCIDATRVKLKRFLLESKKNGPNSSLNQRSNNLGAKKNDYIHGNYVVIPNSDYIYICTQGPLPNTIEDFLLMCWQEDSKVIVMLCELEEDNSEKCSKYWPNVKETSIFGKIRVYNEREDGRKYEGITIRTLKIQIGDSKKVIIQYQLKSWPDHLVPPSSTILVTLLREVQLISSRNPIIVHCSAGIGRTGTFIGIHYASERFKEEINGDLTLLDVIREIRTQRLHSVQSTIQYAYLNICLLEYFALDNIVEYNDNVKDFITKNIAYIQEYARRLLIKKSKINLK